jgi:hypothetical protein
MNTKSTAPTDAKTLERGHEHAAQVGRLVAQRGDVLASRHHQFEPLAHAFVDRHEHHQQYGKHRR